MIFVSLFLTFFTLKNIIWQRGEGVKESKRTVREMVKKGWKERGGRERMSKGANKNEL